MWPGVIVNFSVSLYIFSRKEPSEEIAFNQPQRYFFLYIVLYTDAPDLHSCLQSHVIMYFL